MKNHISQRNLNDRNSEIQKSNNRVKRQQLLKMTDHHFEYNHLLLFFQFSCYCYLHFLFVLQFSGKIF